MRPISEQYLQYPLQLYISMVLPKFMAQMLYRIKENIAAPPYMNQMRRKKLLFFKEKKTLRR
jgi:hypothetical protein